MSHRILFRSTVLVLIAALPGCSPRPESSSLSAAMTLEAHDIDPAKFDSDPKPQPAFTPAAAPPGPLRLTLTLVPDAPNLSVRLRAENAGTKNFDWDNEFISGLEWRVTVSDGTSFPEPKTVEVEPPRKGRDGKELPAKTAPLERAHLKLHPDPRRYPMVKDSFEHLEPGKSTTREIDLTSLGRIANWVELVEIEATGKKERVGKHEFEKFALPAGMKLVRVRAHFDPRHPSVRSIQKPDGLSLPPAADSNALEILVK